MSRLTELVTRRLGPGDIGSFLLAGLASFQNVYVEMSVDQPIVPGSPIPITIYFWSYDHSLDFGNGCTLKVFLMGTDRFGNAKQFEIFSWPAKAGDAIPYVADSSPMAMSIGEFHYEIDPLPSTSAVGKAIYAFGDHDLLVEITANGKDAGPYSDGAILTVVPEAVDQSWWIWGDLRWRDGFYHPDGYVLQWKESYSLWGFCSNLTTANIRMDFTVNLNETDAGGATRTIGTTFASLPKNGGSPMLTFPEITQDWKWLEEVVWLVVGPLHRTFLYVTDIAITDEYGNQYSLASAPLGLTVNVSNKKQQLAEAAAGTGFSAWFLTVVSIIVPWVGIAAGAVGTASQVLGVEALDPPAPDKKFLVTVEPKISSLPSAMRKDRRLLQFGKFVGTIQEILACMEALDKIESKIMGATNAKSEEGLNLQKKSYRRVVRQMVKAANRLPVAADLASASLAAAGIEASKEYRAFASGNARLPMKEIDKRLRDIGHSKESRALAGEFLSNPRWRKTFLSLETNARQLRRASLALTNVALTIERETSSKLRTYKARKNGGVGRSLTRTGPPKR